MVEHDRQPRALPDARCTACGGPVLQGWTGDFAQAQPLFLYRGAGPSASDALVGKVIHLRAISTVCIQCGHLDQYVDPGDLQQQLELVDTRVWKLPNLE
ncbi:MAG: hypothetical protein KKB13_24420 [Chloroflexi bacterium]|nr:hypothetical protein [Chloroflexota bacterium]